MIGGSCSTYGERRGLYRVVMGKSEGDPDIDGRVLVTCIFSKWDVVYGLDRAGLG